MSAIALVAALIILASIAGCARRSKVLRQAGHGTTAARSRRLRHRRRRQAAGQRARSLAAAILDGRGDPTAHLAAGIVLHRGEIAWLQTRSRLGVRSSQPVWTVYTPASGWGRHTRRASDSRAWVDHGAIDWLITSQRIAGRYRASGELISVWWSGLVGVDIDLKRDRLILNGVDGWIGQLTGPEVAPIAVAAVAMCHEPQALGVHRALVGLRGIDDWQRASSPDMPLAQTDGATILTMPRRRQTS